MSEVERRRQYTETRVLIDSVKILSPTFDDGDLYFTGSQIELMRNLMQYANRIESYVAEYEPGYYLTPDNDDWDDIQAIVADLEEVLMGNPNTLWGYADRYARIQSDQSDTLGAFTINLPAVTAGYVYTVLGVGVLRTVNIGSYARVQLVASTIPITLEDIDIGALSRMYPSTREIVLAPGDNIRVIYNGSTVDEYLFTSAWGYKTLVA